MHIYPIIKQQINSQNYSKDSYTKNICKPQNNISFKSLGYYLITLAAKEGISGYTSGYKKIKYVKQLEEGINEYYKKEQFADVLRALSKTPDSFYDYDHPGWAFWLDFRDVRTGIDELRCMALRHFSSVPDNTTGNIQTKKEFLQSFMDNGHEISETFLNVFRNLNDSLYSTSKVSIIDTGLYSVNYNRIRKMKDYSYCFPTEYYFYTQPFRDSNKIGKIDSAADIDEAKRIAAYSNLKLISTLDKNAYRNYIERNRNAIEQSKNILEEYFNGEIFTRYHDETWIEKTKLGQDYKNNILTI